MVGGAHPTPDKSALFVDRQMALATHFITLDISLGEAQGDLVGAIESALAERGEPLRWAITQVNSATHTATIEAVVTTHTNTELL